MKNILYFFLIVTIVIIGIVSFISASQPKFYYSFDEKIYLNELDNKIIVRFNENKFSDINRLSFYSESVIKNLEWRDDSTCIITTDASNKNSLMNIITERTDVKSCNPIYLAEQGGELGIIDEIILEFKKDIHSSEIDDMLRYYNLEIIKTTKLYQLFKLPANSDVLMIANKIQESGLTVYCHPNFICDIVLHQVIPNDSYFTNQFSLHNTGQVFTDGHSGTADADIDAPEAWQFSKGTSGIIVAVLDQGVTSNHPDLPNTRQVRLNGSNFGSGDSNNPSPTGNNNHGNACSGIIAATQNNNQGISGLAPNCKIMPIRMIDYPYVTTPEIVDAFELAVDNGARVLSNSWGYASSNPNLIPEIVQAIQYAVNNGRVVVFSAGNTADHVHGTNGYVAFPSNVNISGVFTVGASERYDHQANYSPTSNPGSPYNQIIDLVAPSHRAYSCQISTETFECWTIDIPNDPGYNSVHSTDCGSLPVVGSVLPNSGTNYLSYSGRMGGTSFACPQVAGVAALMLSINPNLTPSQIFSFITTNADKVGGYTYTNGFSNEMGYGRLNACKAVRQAILSLTNINITASSELPLCYGSQTTYTINNLPSSVTVTWTASPGTLFQTSSGTGTSAILRPASSSSFGPATITFKVTSSCGLITYSKNLQVGKFDTSQFTVTGEMYPCAGQIYTYTASINNPAFQYNWTYPAWWYPVYQESNYIVLQVPEYSSGSGTVYVSIHNGCNWSGYSGMPVYWYQCYGGYAFNYFPNPASEELNVNVVDETTGKTFESREIEFSVNLYNESKQLVKSGLSEKNKIIIDVKDLPKGTYFLHIIDKNEIIKEQIFIE